MNDYPEEKNRSDIFNFGGFAKVQPYYGRIAEVHARETTCGRSSARTSTPWPRC